MTLTAQQRSAAVSRKQWLYTAVPCCVRSADHQRSRVSPAVVLNGVAFQVRLSFSEEVVVKESEVAVKEEAVEGRRGVKRRLDVTMRQEGPGRDMTLNSFSPVFAQVAGFTSLDVQATQALVDVGLEHGLKELARLTLGPQHSYRRGVCAVASCVDVGIQHGKSTARRLSI